MWYEKIPLYAPPNLSEALALCQELPDSTILAGGTDLLVQLRDSNDKVKALINIAGLPELQTIERLGNTVRLGAGVTFSRFLQQGVDFFPPLTEAVRQLASPSIRNRATFGGNIVNASPAADTLPPLYAADAVVILQSIHGKRRVGLAEFILGPKRTALQTGEILIQIEWNVPENYIYYYRKIGTRRALALSKVSFCGLYLPEDKTIRLAYGAVGPTVMRALAAEARFSKGDRESLLAAVTEMVQPINDQRSTADYRRFICRQLTREFLTRIP